MTDNTRPDTVTRYKIASETGAALLVAGGLVSAFGCDALSRWSCPPPTGCHLYFARRVSSLSCADISPPAAHPHCSRKAALDVAVCSAPTDQFRVHQSSRRA